MADAASPVDAIFATIVLSPAEVEELRRHLAKRAFLLGIEFDNISMADRLLGRLLEAAERQGEVNGD